MCFVLYTASAQDTLNISGMPESPEKRDLRVSLNADGSKFVQFILWNQVWVRHFENNPGTMVNDNPTNYTTDIALRRIRAIALLNLSPRYRFFVNLGIDNQTYNTGGGTGSGPTGMGKRADFYYHDAYNEYTLIPDKNQTSGEASNFTLNIGAGLHGWNGVSRMYNGNGITTLGIDIMPPSATTDLTDQFGRQLGMYVRGHWSNLSYRFAANKPFATNLIPQVGGPAVDNNSKGNLAYSSYLTYNFWERESQDVSVFSFNYLGSKKVLNIGSGFYTTANATMSQPSEGIFKNHAITILGADVFLDMPTGHRGAAFTTYISYYSYRLGPNYVRNIGLMNPGVPDPNFTGQRGFGAGNSQLIAGTGDVWYGQAGYLIPKVEYLPRLQPFVALFSRNFDAVNQSGNTYQAGVNFLIDHHRSKITFQFDSRPIYDDVSRRIFRRGKEFYLGAQLFF
ncbi:porin [Sphingobacterium corticibacter]|uniref:Porin n=2 Tax=Sphingobacterium corticibacter TaxID=2171749 RepID=A0A2T8HJ03_9SPHI|nr:porin [Sphingobacterium corticibacter]